MIFRIQEGDTVYATRRGVACVTALPQQLLIYHPDHTFAAYLMMHQNFIHAGEEVMTGQPIGIAGVLGVSLITISLIQTARWGIHIPILPLYSVRTREM